MPCVMYVGALAPLRNVCMVHDTGCHTLYALWCVGRSVCECPGIKPSRVVGKSSSLLGALDENIEGRTEGGSRKIKLKSKDKC